MVQWSVGWVVVEIDDPLLFQTTRFVPYFYRLDALYVP